VVLLNDIIEIFTLADFHSPIIFIIELIMAGLKSAKARGKKGGRTFHLTKGQVRLAQEFTI